MKVLGWISGKLNEGTAAVGRVVVTSWARKLADGKLGPGAAKAYYWLSAHAAAIMATVGALAGCLEIAAQRPEYLVLVGLTPAQVQQWAVWLAGYVVPVLMSAKLITDQWHTIGHPSWMRAPWAVWLKEHSALLTYLSGGALWYVQQCHDGTWCGYERWALFVVGVVGANFGILPRADHAIPPAKVLEGLAGLIAPPTPKVAEQAAQIAALPDDEANASRAMLALVAVGQADTQKLTPAEKAEDVNALKAVSVALENAKGA